MFSYIEKDSFLHGLNPMIKLLTILLLTILISLSLFPVLAFITFLFTVILTWKLGRFSLREIFRRVSTFLILGLSFMFFMLILKGLDNPNADYFFAFLSWSENDFVSILSLGLRIIVFAFMSQVFVLTTRPNDLVLSLILQLKISCVHGYAALAAYRFLPTLQTEVKNIRLAQEIRGIEWDKGLINRLKSPARLILPLFCNAARRGERVAIAMESRGLGTEQNRTFYKRTSITKDDKTFLICLIIIYTVLISILIYFNLFRFSFGFNLS